MTEIDLAYLAGIIDGEGCISIVKYPWGHFNCRISVVNTDVRLMVWLQESWGGGLSTPRQVKPHWKPTMMWILSGEKAVDLIKELQPYLMLKKEQAEVFLSYWELHQRLQVSRKAYDRGAFREEASVLKEAMGILNAKGVTVRS